MESKEKFQESDPLQLNVSDPTQLPYLRDWLRQQPDVRVSLASGMPAPGEQGALTFLLLFAGSGGLVAAINVLPEFLRSRRSNVHIEAMYRGKKFVLDATNVDEVLPIMERFLNE